MENMHEQNEAAGVYERLKHMPAESLTEQELSEAVRRDIRCIGLVPEGMKTEGIPGLSNREIEDIRLVSDSVFMDGTFGNLPPERRTEAVSQAAVLADALHMASVPENRLSDDFITDVLRKDGQAIFTVNMNRRTPEMYAAALENTVWALMHFPREAVTAEMAANAVERDGRMLNYVPDELKTPELCRAAMSDSASRNCCLDEDIIGAVPFPEVCLERLEKYEREGMDPFMLFGSMDGKVITPELAEPAVRMEPQCFQMVPERAMTPGICSAAVEKDWMNLRFVPARMKSKELCETAMKQSIHAQQCVPERFRTPEMYLHSVKAGGMALEYVPENCRTPEVCLQAVLSSPRAEEFVPKRFKGPYHIYEFYGKLKEQLPVAGQLSFDRIRKIFNGEKIEVRGLKYAKNVTLRDFTVEFDRKTGNIHIEAADKKPDTGQNHRPSEKPEKRKGMKM